jgi:hypothetical protein
MKALRATIETTGFIAPPLLVAKRNRYEVVNGHRRLAVADDLGIKRVQCLVIDHAGPEERAMLFAADNMFARALNGNEQLDVALAEGGFDALASVKPAAASRVERIEEIFGSEKRVAELRSQGCALWFIPKHVRCIDSWCLGYGLKRPTDRAIGEWIVKFRASRLVDTLARNINAKTATAVVKAIHEGHDYKGPRR